MCFIQDHGLVKIEILSSATVQGQYPMIGTIFDSISLSIDATFQNLLEKTGILSADQEFITT
jgi:hypothetical protein